MLRRIIWNQHRSQLPASLPPRHDGLRFDLCCIQCRQIAHHTLNDRHQHTPVDPPVEQILNQRAATHGMMDARRPAGVRHNVSPANHAVVFQSLHRGVFRITFRTSDHLNVHAIPAF
jgi:hypothetical protein